MQSLDRPLILIVSIISLFPPHTTRGETIFRDSFADGDSKDGHPVTWQAERLAPGRYDATSGDYVLSGGRIMISTVPDLELADTSIRTRGRIRGKGSPDDFLGVGVRRGSVFGYAAGLGRTGLLDIIRVDPNFRPIALAHTQVDFNSIDQDVIVQLDAIGDELSVWAWPAGEPMPTEPQLRARDSTYATGAPGIATVAPASGEAIFHFVHVADSHLASVAGDVSFDGTLSVDDLDELSSAIDNGDASGLFDVNADGAVNLQDLTFWVHELDSTWFGDTDLNGEFNSNDLVRVFQSGEYEDHIADNSSWEDGDWNGDRDFTTEDLVVAFQDGGYESGPRNRVEDLPEPTTLQLLSFALICIRSVSRSRRPTV